MLYSFIEQLADEERWYAFVQQDSATNTARTSTDALKKAFGSRSITSGLWPPLSPALTPCDYYLWRTVNQKVYS
jgi:hypothetical protein